MDVPTGLEVKSPGANDPAVEDPEVDKLDADTQGANN